MGSAIDAATSGNSTKSTGGGSGSYISNAIANAPAPQAPKKQTTTKTTAKAKKAPEKPKKGLLGHIGGIISGTAGEVKDVAVGTAKGVGNIAAIPYDIAKTVPASLTHNDKALKNAKEKVDKNIGVAGDFARFIPRSAVQVAESVPIINKHPSEQTGEINPKAPSLFKFILGKDAIPSLQNVYKTTKQSEATDKAIAKTLVTGVTDVAALAGVKKGASKATDNVKVATGKDAGLNKFIQTAKQEAVLDKAKPEPVLAKLSGKKIPVKDESAPIITPQEHQAETAKLSQSYDTQIKEVKNQPTLVQKAERQKIDNEHQQAQNALDKAAGKSPTFAEKSSVAHPEVARQTWFHGTDSLNKGKSDTFYSADKSVAGDYGTTKLGNTPKITKADQATLPKNPLVVSDKEELASRMGYEGDPFNQPKGKASFDGLAKEYAKTQGHDGILYQEGSLGAPELHQFGANEVKPTEVTKPEAPQVAKTEKPAVKTETKPVEQATKKPIDNSKSVSRVYARLKSEHPELKDDVSYEAIQLKKDAEKAVDLISKDKNKAFRVAMGAEDAKDVTSTGVNIAMAEKALDEGNTALYAQLIKKRSLDQTRRGQELVAEKGSVTDNSTARYVKELIASRMDKAGKNYLGDVTTNLKKTPVRERAVMNITKEVEKAQKRIKNKELDIAEAQRLLDSLVCK